MAFAQNEFLISDPVENIRCRQHASQTFVTDQFRLLPKDKFLFHVAFNINWQGIKPTTIEAKLLETLKNEINLLVKNIDLPTYTVSAETLNQYNRKRVVQYQHKYSDVKLSFHDDNMGLINQLWQTYYKYFYNDPTVASAKGAYNKTATLASSYITNPYGFIGRVKPFFNYITIYQMSRHEFVSYKLINPIITHWGGGNLAYHSGDSHSFDMTLAYEAVSYGTGYVNDGKMEGFGISHYDYYPSPIQPGTPMSNTSTYPAFPKSAAGTANSVSVATATSAALGALLNKTTTSNLANNGSVTGSQVATGISTGTGTTGTGNANKLGTNIPTGTTNSTGSTAATQVTTNVGNAKATGAAAVVTGTGLKDTSNYGLNG